MTLVRGYEVVCPDGKVRHFPYHNEGDAMCDAEVFDHAGRCAFEVDTPDHFRVHGPCSSGPTHRVQPIVFQHPPQRGEA